MHDIFMKNISEGGLKLIIGVCPIYMSRRVVHKINYRSMSTIYVTLGSLSDPNDGSESSSRHKTIYWDSH